MKRIVFTIIFVLAFFTCFGQNEAEKYMRKPELALQDARVSFADGEYEKTINLLKIYSALSKNNDGIDILRKAQECMKYVEKAKLHAELGDDSEELNCYRNILLLNPDDPAAKSKVNSISFDEIRDYNIGIACVRKGNKWGAIDEDKNIIIPIIYDGIRDFWPFNPKQITTEAKKNGKSGFVNKYGKEVTPFIYSGIRGIELDTPNIYFMVYKPNSPEVFVDMQGIEYPTEDEAAYGVLGLRKRNSTTSGPYKIGDFYNENGIKGIVFEINESGTEGKIVSLTQDYTDWALEDSEYINKQIGLFDDYDGENNFIKIKQIKNWSIYFPGFKWCSNIGAGWYLPAKYELKAINDNIKLIDEGLKYAGYRPMNRANYMSSTEKPDANNQIYYMWGMGGKPGDIQDCEKTGNWVIAVRKFGERSVTVHDIYIISCKTKGRRR